MGFLKLASTESLERLLSGGRSMPYAYGTQVRDLRGTVTEFKLRRSVAYCAAEVPVGHLCALGSRPFDLRAQGPGSPRSKLVASRPHRQSKQGGIVHSSLNKSGRIHTLG